MERPKGANGFLLMCQSQLVDNVYLALFLKKILRPHLNTVVKRAVSVSDVCSRMYGKKGSLHAMGSGCCDVLPRGALWD